MPMFYFCWNVNAVTWFHLDGFFAFFLIVTTACNADNHLSTAIFCMVDMPVVTAAWFECYVEDSNLLCGNWRKVALAYKVLCKCIIWCISWMERCLKGRN